MFTKIRSRMQGEGGFTLIELLVVIIIIAILAAIAIPTFLGQRQKAQDAAAKALVRNAMTSVESQYVDSKTYVTATAVPAAILIEPSITFIAAGAAAATTSAIAATALAAQDDVDVFGDATSYSVGTVSASGNKFGVVAVKAGTGAGTTFMKIIGTAAASSGW